jgi:hypothetical protein
MTGVDPSALDLIPDACAVADRLAQIEEEAKLLKRLLSLAIHAQEQRERRQAQPTGRVLQAAV